MYIRTTDTQRTSGRSMAPMLRRFTDIRASCCMMALWRTLRYNKFLPTVTQTYCRTSLNATATFTTSTAPELDKKLVEVTFIKANGERIKTKGKVGDSLLDVVVNNNIDLDGFGACEGTLTCSTCHLIFKKEDYEQLPDKPTDEELDMLDLAYDLTDTSRLGCQIILSEKLKGLEVRVPVTINDARGN